MKALRVALALSVAALAFAAEARAAEPTNYRIVERIKVPDGGFDYATFDAATNRVYMPRGTFTTVIDVKTESVATRQRREQSHCPSVPGTNLIVFTHSKGLIRLADKATDKVLAEFQGEKNPNSAAYDPITKLVFVLNKDSGTATIVDPAARKVVGTIPISPNILEFPVADGAGKIFDNVETTAEIAVIDVKTQESHRHLQARGLREAVRACLCRRFEALDLFLPERSGQNRAGRYWKRNRVDSHRGGTGCGDLRSKAKTCLHSLWR